ncbi:MAG: helix-turn-helix domain-containing protein [Clostridia bacterium]|nr:helix-turn-helix domain-containing protein [Clostridia bacterium]
MIQIILVIHDKNYKAVRLAESIRSLGFLTIGSAAKNAVKELGPRYRAIILIEPKNFEIMPNLVKALNNSVFEAPIFTLGEASARIKSELYLPLEIPKKLLMSKIVTYLDFYGYPLVGNYRCGGFDASVYSRYVSFLDTKIPLTKTECMILRYLAKAYPAPTPIKEIIKNVFPHTRLPQPSNIRAHISNMNAKFTDYINRPKIKFIKNKGYVIITPQNTKIT